MILSAGRCGQFGRHVDQKKVHFHPGLLERDHRRPLENGLPGRLIYYRYDYQGSGKRQGKKKGVTSRCVHLSSASHHQDVQCTLLVTECSVMYVFNYSL